MVQRDEIAPFMRTDLLTWIYDLNAHYEYPPMVAALTQDLVDRVLGIVKVGAASGFVSQTPIHPPHAHTPPSSPSVQVKRSHLFVIGVSCFLMAAKVLEEESVSLVP